MKLVSKITRFKKKVFVKGKIKITNFSDIILYENTECYICEKKFRFSIDNLNFTDWQDINNLIDLEIETSSNIFLEFKYKKCGSQLDYILDLDQINIEAVRLVDLSPIENFNIIFNPISENEFYSENFRSNVLTKILGNFLPKFIKNDSIDALNFWDSIILFFSLIYNYAKKFEKIFYNDFLKIFIKQKDLIICDETTTHFEMQNLTASRLNYIKQRGTFIPFLRKDEKIFNYEQKIDGEVLRYFCVDEKDEFSFLLEKKECNGWFLNKSSFNFPVILNENFFKLKEVISTSTFESDFLNVNVDLDYHLIIALKKTENNLKIKIKGYNENGVEIQNVFKNANNYFTNIFIDENITSIAKIENQKYFLRFALFSLKTLNFKPNSNLNFGHNLTFVKEVKKVKFFIELDGTVSTSIEFIFKPLLKGKNISQNFYGKENLKNSNGFIQSRPFLHNWVITDKDKSINFIENKILPFRIKYDLIRLNKY